MNTTTGVSNFEPWPPENGFRHEMSKENFLDILLVGGKKETKKTKVNKLKDNSEMTH